MWFITLVVLAIAAILVIKAVKAQSKRKSAGEADALSSSGLQGQLKRDSSSHDMAESQAAANDSGQLDSPSVDENTVDTPQVSTTDTVEPAGSQQDELQEIREMIKILNLAEVDSSRLNISAEQFNALRDENDNNMQASAMPSREAQADIADRLRRMLA